MAKNPISRIHHLSARLEAHLHEFVTPMDEFNETHRANRRSTKDELRAARSKYNAAKNGNDEVTEGAREKLAKTSHVRRGAVIGALGGAAAGVAAMLRKSPRGSSKMTRGALGAGAGALIGASGGTEIGGRIRKKETKELQALSSRLEAHLHQFEPMDDETDYSPVQQEKKKNPILRAGMAGGAVAGGVAIAANKDKIKAGYQTAKAGVTEAGRTAAFKGMRGTADVLNKGGNLANRVAKKAGTKEVGAIAGGAGGLLKKGAKFLKKNSMKFFSSADIAGIQRIEAKFRRFGV